MTVDEVMRRTGLSRPSFYVYFRDRHELVLRVVAHLETELLTVANRWFDSVGGGPDLLREALAGFAKVYGDHAAVLRALADAAADDPDVEAAYGELIQRFVAATAAHIEQEVAAGNLAGLDAAESAKALAWMTERYLYHAYGPVERVPRAKILETLSTMWIGALYLRR